MDYATYSAASLEKVLQGFERTYEMSSEEFMAAHVADDDRLADMPGFNRHSWASFYAEWRELDESTDDFAENVEHELALQ